MKTKIRIRKIMLCLAKIKIDECYRVTAELKKVKR